LSDVTFSYEENFGISNSLAGVRFSSVRDGAVVKFFSRADIQENNLRVVGRDWDYDHICAFFRVIDMPELIKKFKGKITSGHQLLDLTTEDPINVALRLQLTLPEVEDFFNCIDDLQGEENVEILKLVKQEVAAMNDENEESLREKAYQQIGLPQQWQQIQSKISQQFDVLVIGTRSVGKTSLIQSFELMEFDEVVQPTFGVKPVDHILGKSSIRFWDASGKIFEYSKTIFQPEMADVVLFVYDISDGNSFDWLEVFLMDHPEFSETYTVLIGNKLDLVDEEEAGHSREIFMEDIEDFCNEFDIDVSFEVSAKTSMMVHEAISDALLKSIPLNKVETNKPRGVSLDDPLISWEDENFETTELINLCESNRIFQEYCTIVQLY
jgi:GTPase SAR1 family protein